MAKIQTRMDKYSDYRHQILTEDSAKSEIEKKHDALKNEKKALLDKEKEERRLAKKNEKQKVNKTIYHEYVAKKRIKYFFYAIFVLAVIACLVYLLAFLINNYF